MKTELIMLGNMILLGVLYHYSPRPIYLITCILSGAYAISHQHNRHKAFWKEYDGIAKDDHTAKIAFLKKSLEDA